MTGRVEAPGLAGLAGTGDMRLVLKRAAAADTDRVPIVKYLNIAYGKEREHEIGAGLVLNRETEHIPLSMIDA